MKIYSQQISGKYRNIKSYFAYFLILLYLLSSWLRWDRGPHSPNQALLIDLPNRHFYAFGIEIWPDEAYYITGVLILAALGLFFVTSLFGRIWCGFGCPHTVFTDIFVKIEHYFQGDRNARMKLDAQPYNKNKIMKKCLTFISWLGVGFVFAFGWVSYFYDAPTLAHDLINLSISQDGMYWLTGLTISTVLFAGFVRERVCKYMCPYGRFQSAMLDNDTDVVTYHGWRNDCIECGKCVFVCPMGIDIRDGLQMPCIGCGLCVDACDSVMDKIGKPLGLIDFDSVNSTELKMKGAAAKSKKIFHFKTIFFAAIFGVVNCALLYALIHKPKIKFNVLRDRGALYTILPNGDIRNSYTLKLINKTNQENQYRLYIDGLNDYEVKIQGEGDYMKSYEFTMQKENEKELVIFVKVPINSIGKNENHIRFNVLNLNNAEIAANNSVFIGGDN